jgi:hypothetical protein
MKKIKITNEQRQHFGAAVLRLEQWRIAKLGTAQQLVQRLSTDADYISIGRRLFDTVTGSIGAAIETVTGTIGALRRRYKKRASPVTDAAAQRLRDGGYSIEDLQAMKQEMLLCVLGKVSVETAITAREIVINELKAKLTDN